MRPARALSNNSSLASAATRSDASVARGLSRLRESVLDEVARAVHESLDRFASQDSGAYTGSEA